MSDPRVPERSGSTTIPQPDLEWHETVPGRRPGDRFVRVARHKGFTRVRRGHLVAQGAADAPTTLPGRALRRLRRLLIGRRLATKHEAEERLNVVQGLAVFSNDALSSIAYATEETMKVLVLGGLSAIAAFTMPLSLLIAALLAIVVLSYMQTIKAYPSGGGSYIVASDNLGTFPGLIAAAALLIDYITTAAVSVAAGAAALTSLLPALLPYTTWLAVGAVALITLVNLRGVRETGNIFAVPVYVFVATVYLLLGYGLFRLVTGGLEYTPPDSAITPGTGAIGLLFLMSAFSQGCTALTGVECVSNGVPAFKPPEWRNARATMVLMGVLLGSMFLGVSVLATRIGVLPAEEETVLSQIGRTVFGPGPLWVLLQVATALILILAANTAFADFPRLASILARDRFLPRMFQFRGDRLAFTTGIVNLAAFSGLLLVVFQGSVDALIPLFAIGVFSSFTLSQAGMVLHWHKERGPNWRRSAAINGLGALTTGIVALVVITTKFTHGAWLVCVLVPFFIGLMLAINTHYRLLDRARRPETPLSPEEVTVRAVVPIADLGVETRQALAYARAVAHDHAHVAAVHVVDDAAEAEHLRRKWEKSQFGVELVIIESPFRSLAGPLLAYIDTVNEAHPHDTITVVVPEFVPTHWWEQFLHNQTALRLKAALLFHPGIVVANVPYHLAPQAAA